MVDHTCIYASVWKVIRHAYPYSPSTPYSSRLPPFVTDNVNMSGVKHFIGHGQEKHSVTGLPPSGICEIKNE